MKNTTLYYFSGTGNSLFVAKQLHNALQESKLVPLLPLLKGHDLIQAPQCVGFIFPVYQAILPLVVRQVMERMDFSRCTYIFAVATRAGTTHRAFEMMDDILKKQGKILSLSTSVDMANNDPKFKYHLPTEQEIERYESGVKEVVARIVEKINMPQSYRPVDDTFTLKTPLLSLLAWVARLTERSYGGFYADHRCIGCGLCQRVCTSRKIVMTENKPVWQKEIACYKCAACLNYCPVSAVQIKNFTEKNGRYTHPYATEEVIIAQREGGDL